LQSTNLAHQGPDPVFLLGYEWPFSYLDVGSQALQQLSEHGLSHLPHLLPQALDHGEPATPTQRRKTMPASESTVTQDTSKDTSNNTSPQKKKKNKENALSC